MALFLIPLLFFLPKRLRIYFFLFLLFLFLSDLPIFRVSTKRVQPLTVGLLDDSESMQLGHPVRQKEAEALFRRLAPLSKSLFPLSHWTHRRNATFLFTGLGDLSREVPSGSQLLLFSDGAAEDMSKLESAAELVRARGIKLFLFPVGAPLSGPFSLDWAPPASPLFLGETAAIPLYFTIREAPLAVTVSAEDLPLRGRTPKGERTTRLFYFTRPGSFERLLKIPLSTGGERKLKIEASVQEVRQVRAQGVRVEKEKLVALLCGRPHPDCKVWRHFLEQQAGFQVASFFWANGGLYPNASQAEKIISKAPITFLLYPNCELLKLSKKPLFLLLDQPLHCTPVSVEGSSEHFLTAFSLDPLSPEKSASYSLQTFIPKPSESFTPLLFFHSSDVPFAYRCPLAPSCLLLAAGPLYPTGLKEPQFAEHLLEALFALLRRGEPRIVLPPPWALPYVPYRVLLTGTYALGRVRLTWKEKGREHEVLLQRGREGLSAMVSFPPGVVELTLHGEPALKKKIVVGTEELELAPPAYRPAALLALAQRAGGQFQKMNILKSLLWKDYSTKPLPLFPFAFLFLVWYWRERLLV